MPEDPRILTRAKVDFMLGVGIDTMEDAQKFFDHDLAQRERIATLEEEVQSIRDEACSDAQFVVAERDSLKKGHAELRHGLNCPANIPLNANDCTCGLAYRIQLRTEIEMHGAWRKRAEEAESRETSLRTELSQVTAQRATLEADNRRLFEHVIAISTTAGNRSISEMELRAKIIGVCHSALQPAAPQLSGEAGEKE